MMTPTASQTLSRRSLKRMVRHFWYGLALLGVVGIMGIIFNHPFLAGWCLGNLFVYATQYRRIVPNKALAGTDSTR